MFLALAFTRKAVVFFCSSQIRTLVAMAPFRFHRLIMGKVKISNFIFREMFIEKCTRFQMTSILIAYFDWLLGPQKGQIFEKKKIFKNPLFRNCLLYKADTLH